MGKCLIEIPLLKEKISSDPPPLIPHRKDPDGHFQRLFRGILFPHPLKDSCEIEPIFLFERISLNGFPKIMNRFLEIDLLEVPLIKKAQSIKRIGIGRFDLSGFEEIFFGKVCLVERNSSPC
jgi:hypothetical protein